MGSEQELAPAHVVASPCLWLAGWLGSATLVPLVYMGFSGSVLKRECHPVAIWRLRIGPEGPRAHLPAGPAAACLLAPPGSQHRPLGASRGRVAGLLAYGAALGARSSQPPLRVVPFCSDLYPWASPACPEPPQSSAFPISFGQSGPSWAARTSTSVGRSQCACPPGVAEHLKAIGQSFQRAGKPGDPGKTQMGRGLHTLGFLQVSNLKP